MRYLKALWNVMDIITALLFLIIGLKYGTEGSYAQGIWWLVLFLVWRNIGPLSEEMQNIKIED